MGFAHDLAETEKTEADSVAAYDALMTSKNKELVAARSTCAAGRPNWLPCSCRFQEWWRSSRAF